MRSRYAAFRPSDFQEALTALLEGRAETVAGGDFPADSRVARRVRALAEARSVGATPEGKKELIRFHVGVRESAQSWRSS